MLISSIVNAATINVGEYANLALGYIWTYEQSMPNSPWTVEVDSVTTKNGYGVFLLQEYDSNGSKNDQHFIASDFSNGMFSVGGLNDYGQSSEQEFFTNPPVPILLSTFEPGQPHPFSFEQMGMNIDGTLTIIKDSVSVPAGTFSDTYKATQVGRYGSDEYVTTSWYSRGIGLVKRVQDGNVWELTGYSGFTAPVPLPATVWLFASALGLIGLLNRVRRFSC